MPQVTRGRSPGGQGAQTGWAGAQTGRARRADVAKLEFLWPAALAAPPAAHLAFDLTVLGIEWGDLDLRRAQGRQRVKGVWSVHSPA